MGSAFVLSHYKLMQCNFLIFSSASLSLLVNIEYSSMQSSQHFFHLQSYTQVYMLQQVCQVENWYLIVVIHITCSCLL